ncbi:olfactory receptor 14J1-like, partial [Indicator indicator]
MYFSLLKFALLDLGAISTTMPKSMSNSLRDTRDISCAGCVVQFFFLAFLLAAEYFLLTTMSYDRYVAICRPLHYETLPSSRVCVHMAAAAWASGILKLSCSTSNLRELWLLVVTACLAFVCFVFIVVSYVQIFRVVLRIPSQQGRHKAFATCLPHLAVLSLFVTTGIFAHLKPSSISSPSLDLLLAVLHSVVPRAVNPLIYSLRNQELKAALS